MSTRRLHVDSPLIIKDAYMMCIQYQNSATDVSDHSRITRKLYRLMTTTWGISPLQPFYSSAYVINFGGILSSRDSPTVCSCAYVCFSSKEDALMFMLSCDVKCSHITMWPEGLKFTIHEFVEPTKE